MTGGRAVLAGLLAAGLVAAVAPASAALAAAWLEPARACVDTLQTSDARLLPLEIACPDTARALGDDPWAALLAQPVAELPAGALADLLALNGFYQTPAVGPTVPPAALDAVLADLPPLATDAGLSGWERLREWLLGWFEDRETAPPAWLRELSVADRVAVWLWYLAVALIVLLACAIVVNELRQRTQRHRRPVPEPGVAGVPRAALPATTLAGLRGRPPQEQLGGLLGIVLARLQSRGLLPPRVSLTHREIAAAAGLTDEQRRTVGALSGAAERACYGGWSPASADVGPFIDGTRRLLDELDDGGP